MDEHSFELKTGYNPDHVHKMATQHHHRYLCKTIPGAQDSYSVLLLIARDETSRSVLLRTTTHAARFPTRRYVSLRRIDATRQFHISYQVYS